MAKDSVGSAGVMRPVRRLLHMSRPWPLLIIVGVLFLYPAGTLVAAMFRTSAPGLPGDWSFDPVKTAYTSSATFHSFENSFFYSVAVKVLALVLAILFATITTRTNITLRRFVTPMMVVILALPPLFFALSWRMLAQPGVGALNHVLNHVTPNDWAMQHLDAANWVGLIGATTLKSTALEYLVLLGAFSMMDRSFEEAAEMSGGRRLRVFFTVNVPMLFPVISSVIIMGFVVILGTLDFPLILGTPAHIHVFASDIFEKIQTEMPPQFGQAAAMAFVLAVILFALIYVQRRMMARRSFVTVTGKAFHREPWRLSKTASVFLNACVCLYFLLALALPLFQIILGSFQTFFGVYGNLSFENYRHLFTDSAIPAALRNSLILGVLGGFLSMLLAVTFTYQRSRPLYARRIIRAATWVPYAMPGLILALAFIWAYLSVPGLRSLYATIWIVLLALVVSTVPLTSRISEAALGQVSETLEEAAQMSGASRMRAVVTVTVPLIVPSFLSGWLISGIHIIGNLDVPLILASANSQTTSTAIFTRAFEGDIPEAAALFCVLLLMMAALAALNPIIRIIATWIIRYRRAKRTAAYAKDDLDFDRRAVQIDVNSSGTDG